MKNTLTDYSLFFNEVRGRLTGLMGTYKDGVIPTGTPDFEKETNIISKHLNAKNKNLRDFDLPESNYRR